MAKIVTNKQPKIKLIKDLKYGNVHLRQSLLDMDQFQDIDRLFKNKREQYGIEDQDVHLEKHVTQQNEEQIPAFLTPIQRIALYRKQKMNKKIKEKMNKIFYVQKADMVKVRKPITEKMLQVFQDKYRNQMPISYKESLRQSQMNLEKIKKNDKRKALMENQHKKKSLYLSRIHSEKTNNKTMMNQTRQSNLDTHQRKRFMSLKTSLPERQFHYVPVRQIVQGRNRDENKVKVIDIKNIENQLDAYLSKTFSKKNMNQKLLKAQSNHQDQDKNRSQMSMYKSKTQTNSNQMFQQGNASRVRARSNVDKSLRKSEQSSKQIIETMSNFYYSKNIKKKMYGEMVENIQYDRPLTSSIRRKNYTILGKQSLSPIQQYRSYSELERKKILQKNMDFYKSLLEGLETYHEQDISTTVYVIEEVKCILETQYMFTREILNQLIKKVSQMQIDVKTQQVLQKIGKFVGVDIHIDFQEI